MYMYFNQLVSKEYIHVLDFLARNLNWSVDTDMHYTLKETLSDQRVKSEIV